MEKRVFSFFLVFLMAMVMVVAVLVYSQDWTGQGRQVGYVFDEEGNPIEGVTVKFFFPRTQSGFELKTDASGKWVAMGIKGGSWNIDFSCPGYIPKNVSISVRDFRQKNPSVEITIKKAAALQVDDDVRKKFSNGEKLIKEGKYEEAIVLFEEIIKDYPGVYIANFNIGNSYFKMEKYDEAEQYYKKVLEEAPDYVHATIGIGNCYSNRGDSEKALEWYNKIEFEKIDDPTVLYNMGVIFQKNSKVENALKYYQRAVEIKEDFFDARYQLGLAFLALGKNQEALNEFENYIKYDPESERSAQVKSFIEYLKK